MLLPQAATHSSANLSFQSEAVRAGETAPVSARCEYVASASQPRLDSTRRMPSGLPVPRQPTRPAVNTAVVSFGAAPGAALGNRARAQGIGA